MLAMNNVRLSKVGNASDNVMNRKLDLDRGAWVGFGTGSGSSQRLARNSSVNLYDNIDE